MARHVYAIAFLSVLGLAALAQAQTFTTLYSFTGGTDGGSPLAAVFRSASGELYGTTHYGGDGNCYDGTEYGCGVVFRVDIAGKETVLYTFASQGNYAAGAYPDAPVLVDSKGNIYGTTPLGGFGNQNNCPYGCGVLFKIDAAGNGTALYSFTGGSDGCSPYQGLVMDKAGSLFGTTGECGSFNGGTIFKVDQDGNFTLLHSFAGYPSDGASPTYGHLTIDKSGNLYGVTRYGGAHDRGALFKLSNSRTLTLLHSFSGGTSDGCNPFGSVVQDEDGNLFGTTIGCGHNNAGTIWRVGEKRKETTLHNFAGGTSDGCNPDTGVDRDSQGDLYGVTYGCGANGYGALYKLSPKGRLIVLHSFDGSDGTRPEGEVLRTTTGEMFGTTKGGAGTVWSYVP